MAAISNDLELKQALDNLDAVQQRVVGALFVQNVLQLAIDDRIEKAIKVALKPDADPWRIDMAPYEIMWLKASGD